MDALLFPSEDTIRKLAGALAADTDELPLAHKIPDAIRERVIEHPDVFRRPVDLNDKMLDRVPIPL